MVLWLVVGILTLLGSTWHWYLYNTFASILSVLERTFKERAKSLDSFGPTMTTLILFFEQNSVKPYEYTPVGSKIKIVFFISFAKESADLNPTSLLSNL